MRITGVLLILLSQLAMAHNHKMPSFEDLDKNQDNKLTQAEFTLVSTEKLGNRFSMLDKDGDNSLTKDEFTAKKKKRRACCSRDRSDKY